MRRKTILSLLIAVLMLTGCASSRMPSQPQIPPLDSSLAAECKALPEPPDGDYDELTGWMLDVIGLYGECAARHRAIVGLWKNCSL
ncbi:hypothetical protein NB636_02095 [Oxalobacter aliiformigenes]|uniref:Rz1-like lysis system protein LysC n=1 Tax=Oxalobacter aliiformigenes TaxID=2946593 RepID=UPI0022B050E4|nr:hypothetical protein [Oxalobacter aliiformigenes]MCZ4065664.1 hypothetical protein [Oxalobacter aliiformigenes]WAV99679.1 hypothetical protein NB636_02095 [Oxalobacter aliiformigenes]